ncbi:hypothetical protein [Phenylobacterium sp.]|uniref:hypothetical protein n=1 Tax=Phenylobacterium sp. TaxID=1871053 RepID=UPI0026217719|nr:hypothetical protein [Phenylobacterium sp.]
MGIDWKGAWISAGVYPLVFAAITAAAAASLDVIGAGDGFLELPTTLLAVPACMVGSIVFVLPAIVVASRIKVSPWRMMALTGAGLFSGSVYSLIGLILSERSGPWFAYAQLILGTFFLQIVRDSFDPLTAVALFLPSASGAVVGCLYAALSQGVRAT